MSDGIAGSAVWGWDEALDNDRNPFAVNDQAEGRGYSGAASCAKQCAEDLKLNLAPFAADDRLAGDLWSLAFLHS